MIKMFKRKFRLDVRKFVFSDRVINNWNSLPAHCNSIGTFKTHISVLLDTETNETNEIVD